MIVFAYSFPCGRSGIFLILPGFVTQHNLPLSCEPCAEQERTWLDETLIARGSSTAVGGYLPARTAIKTTVQDRGSTRSSTWPLALGRNTHVCERSFRPWRSETSRTLDDKPGQ